MQLEQTKLLGLQAEIYFHRDISKMGQGGGKSNHLCIAEFSQEAVAYYAMEQVCQKHTCFKNLRLLMIIKTILQQGKGVALKMGYDSKNCFLS